MWLAVAYSANLLITGLLISHLLNINGYLMFLKGFAFPAGTLYRIMKPLQ